MLNLKYKRYVKITLAFLWSALSITLMDDSASKTTQDSEKTMLIWAGDKEHKASDFVTRRL